MGQQQLLLLILAAVIVGVAITLGINMFAQNSAQANQEAVMQDVLTIASRAQAWYRRPVQMGGGGRTYATVTLANLNFPASNANGSYALSGGNATTLTITGTGVEDGDGDGTNLQITAVITPDSVRTMTINP
ncbi:MAG: hypothetical protein ONB48_09255 [candidate division KSB1 bacterium]|nr:hypothetical protein [candidate division KSB1 bacterium]MDZ7273674.1 hypothetical protein [candidate division KSB1 bacterium]MDZ7285830.1 hypothetical protein [candidate division KSB1 bacterium]MDZ7298862.1 hypothetical protein [candidate division KSB1 bacterium]MDZ7307092.1 hypothetical protein [candidate division KSB1 bacterium]